MRDNHKMSIKDKVIIITGASSGIGEAAAMMLADRGAKVMLAARREEQLRAITDRIVAAGGAAAFKVTDVVERDQVQRLVDATIERFGRVDVLLNNAGIMPLSLLHDLRVDEWDRTINVNLKGLLYGIAAVLPHMRERRSGHVINVSSVAGHVVFPMAAVYCATKHAVRALTEGLRREERGKIRTTIVSPGAVETELIPATNSPEMQEALQDLSEIAIDAGSIARAICYAIDEPEDVSINEILVRPSQQDL